MCIIEVMHVYRNTLAALAPEHFMLLTLLSSLSNDDCPMRLYNNYLPMVTVGL